jgi:Uma2 family endonuclease
MGDRGRRRYTIDDLDTLPDGERMELVDGQLVERAAPTFDHGDVQAALIEVLRPRFRPRGPDGRGGWWIVTEVSVAYSPERVCIHDVVGWRKDRVPRRPAGARVTERPDWVCEILSTNRRNDLVDKRSTLHAHGVPHYWVIDDVDRLVTVQRHHADGYLTVSTVGPGDVARLQPFDELELDVASLFDEVPPALRGALDWQRASELPALPLRYAGTASFCGNRKLNVVPFGDVFASTVP